METNQTYYQDLMSRYFSGEATSDEIQLLSAWVVSSNEHKELFEKTSKIWQLVENQRIENTISIDAEWESLSAKMLETPKLEVLTHNTPRTSQRFNIYNALKIAAVLCVIAVSSFLIYHYNQGSKTEVVLAKADKIENNLPDGTSVTLQTGSSIEYPSSFEGNKRNVKLKGEAYFNVTPDKTKPFIISVDDVQIEVLGTSFYVNSNHGHVEVILTQGKVAVYQKDKPGEVTYLSPGEKAECSSKGNSIEKSVNTDVNYMAFKTRRLVFEDHLLSDVVETLNKVYLSKICIKDKAIANSKLTATFDNQSLDAVLKVIKTTLDIHVVKTADGYDLVGNVSK